MAAYDFDLFTIGAGSGGVAASRRAGSYGARVAICEDLRVGGTCVMRGCVPKKLLVYGAHVHEAIEDAKGFGWAIEGAKLDWGELVRRKNQELDRLHGVYIRMLHDAGVKLLDGRGVIEDAHAVRTARSGPADFCKFANWRSSAGCLSGQRLDALMSWWPSLTF